MRRTPSAKSSLSPLLPSPGSTLERLASQLQSPTAGATFAAARRPLPIELPGDISPCNRQPGDRSPVRFAVDIEIPSNSTAPALSREFTVGTTPALSREFTVGTAPALSREVTVGPIAQEQTLSLPGAASTTRAGRLMRLMAVFAEFDMDSSGTIESSELLQLGEMRRQLGQKSGDWSEEKNAQQVRLMDTDGDGVVSGSEFSEHFEKALPKDAQEFEVVVRQFLEVARACRALKEGRKQTSSLPGAPFTTRAGRLIGLKAVFAEFDMDGSGAIESSELFQLGAMRRQLGHKSGGWSEEQNARQVRLMDTNGDGVVSGSEFSEHFEKALPREPQEFEVIVRQFLEVGHACRAIKEGQVKSRRLELRSRVGSASSPYSSSRSHSTDGEVSFQQRLQILLAMEEGTVTLARKIFSRFNGLTDRLPAVLELLESNWGFPNRLFPLLWTHLRRSVFRSRGHYLSVKIGNEEVPPHVQEGEWVEAFGHWLQAVQSRLGHAKLSRKDLVRRHFHEKYSDVNDVYFLGPMLGEGCYGKVHVMFNKAIGVERAVKIISKDQLSVQTDRVETEINIMKLLDHPYIVRIYEIMDFDDTFQIVMDYAEGGDLAAVISRAQKACQLLAESWCRDVAQQICSALEYMHSKGVIHCDLKPANAMLLKPIDPLAGSASAPPHIVLVDFGISEMFQERHRSQGGQWKVNGTPLYLSPEAFDGNVSEKSDMWALGVIVFELLTSRRPFGGENHVRILVSVSTKDPPIDTLPALSREAVRGLLAKDPIARLTAKECRATEWFTSAPAVFYEKASSAQRTSLQSIGHSNYFKRAAMFCVAAGLSMKDMGKLFEIFQAIDNDASGNLSFKEFAAGLQRLGVQEDPASLFAILDVDQNGYISYTEFLAGTLMGKESESLSRQMLREAFRLFDLDGDGSISEHELRVMLSGHGPLVEVLPDGSTVDEIMQEVGNGAGGITFEAFAAYITASQGPMSPFRSVEDGSARTSSKHSHSSQGVLCKMMHDLDVMDSEKEWKTPMSHGRRLNSLLEEEDSTMEPIDAAQPLHKWLSEVCRETDEGAAVNSFLSFPTLRLPPKRVAECLPAISKHFWAGSYLARLLAEEPARDLGSLRSAVADAVRSHEARAAPHNLQKAMLRQNDIVLDVRPDRIKLHADRNHHGQADAALDNIPSEHVSLPLRNPTYVSVKPQQRDIRVGGVPKQRQARVERQGLGRHASESGLPSRQVRADGGRYGQAVARCRSEVAVRTPEIAIPVRDRRLLYSEAGQKSNISHVEGNVPNRISRPRGYREYIGDPSAQVIGPSGYRDSAWRP